MDGGLKETGSINNERNLGLNVQELILAEAILTKKKDAVVDYTKKGFLGGRRVNKNQLKAENSDLLIEEYRKDPIGSIEILRDNMLLILGDKKLKKEEKNLRFDRYLDAYFGLIIKLDNKAFKETNGTVLNGIPDYIPDGLSDMNGDPRINSADRYFREKIRVNKVGLFNQTRDCFSDVLRNSDLVNMDKKLLETYILKRVMFEVINQIKYDHNKEIEGFDKSQSIVLGQYVDLKLGVCRHQALLAQVLFQSFGLDSRLVKGDWSSDVHQGGKHAFNLVKTGNKWNLIDITSSSKQYYFIQPINELDIDLSNKRYSWSFIDNDGDKVNYNNNYQNYYRIVHDLKNLANYR